jgi:HlyD family type I secretion membrane fusion protein
MTDLEAAVQAGPVVRAGLAVVAIGILGLGAWAAFAPLSGAIIAPGHVKVDLNRKVVQHQEGGTVRAIRVRDGDRVKAGQELVVLDDVRVDAQLDLLRTQLDAERAKAARLEAERAYAEKPAFPLDLLNRTSEAKVNEQLARETGLFRARREALETQIAVLRKQIRETASEIAALTEQLGAEHRALKLQNEELAANERLLDQGYVQKTRVLTLQRAVAEYEARHGEHRAELSKARQRAAELELRILSMRNTYAQTAADELKETTARIFDLEERIRPSRDAAERQRIAAPIAGEVVGLRVFSQGAVVGPRDVLMEIVPEDKRLIIEARIRPEDINHVRPGAEADVRLTAYKQRATPLVQGAVTYVSADRLVDSQSAPYYVVHIDVPAEKLAQGGLRLQAGMPAEVFIRTDERTTLDYLLAPVTSYFRRALREPL